MTKYCPSCGKGNDYAGVAPKTCMACGKPLSMASFIEAPKPIKIKPRVIVANDDEEENEDSEFNGEIIVPRKFEVEVIVPKRVTIGGMRDGQLPGGLDTNLPQIPE